MRLVRIRRTWPHARREGGTFLGSLRPAACAAAAAAAAATAAALAAAAAAAAAAAPAAAAAAAAAFPHPLVVSLVGSSLQRREEPTSELEITVCPRGVCCAAPRWEGRTSAFPARCWDTRSAPRIGGGPAHPGTLKNPCPIHPVTVCPRGVCCAAPRWEGRTPAFPA
eukprot:gene865-biopygen19698